MTATTFPWVPDFKVTINGQDLETKDQTKVTEVLVDDRVDAAHLFSVRLGMVDAAVGRSEWIDDQLFREGGKVSIKLGYAGRPLRTMIDGEITAAQPHFSSRGPESLVLYGFDRLHRLRRGKKSRTFQRMSDWEITRKIADEHGLRLQGDPTETRFDHVYQNNLTDLDFLLQRAARIHYEVAVENTTLYFRKSREARTKVATLEWGNPGDQELLNVMLRLTTVDQAGELVVRGWNPKEKRDIVGRAKVGDETTLMNGSRSAGDLTSGAFGRVNTVVVDHPVVSQSEADALARAHFNRRSLTLITGHGVCLGNPDVRAGEVIELKGLGQRFSGLYYVKGSKHICSPHAGGYLTEFSVVRNATTGGQSGAQPATGSTAATGARAATATVSSGAAGAGAAGGATAGATAGKKTDWIEIKLVDQDGKPVPGERYRIELPDGSIRQGVLNSEGVAWEGNLDPGTCKITFPGLDATEWRRT